MKQWNQIALGLLLAIPASGQTAPSAAIPNLPRLLEAALPRYPAIAETAHLTGKVVVQVTVEGGRVVKTDVKSGNRYLESPTVLNLKTWRFAAEVNKTFTVTYTYEISGEESDDPMNPKVEMLPSLDVNILARPFKPTCSDCRSSGSAMAPNQPSDTSLLHEASHAEGATQQ
jgi:hypothetical protein